MKKITLAAAAILCAGTAVASEGHAYSTVPGPSPLAKLVVPMGIMTLVLVILTVSAGLLRRRKPKLLLKWHKRLGILTLITALIHAALVLFTH